MMPSEQTYRQSIRLLTALKKQVLDTQGQDTKLLLDAIEQYQKPLDQSYLDKDEETLIDLVIRIQGLAQQFLTVEELNGLIASSD